ncbi:hypothetical protein [Streptomyces sp. NPDC004788]
MSGAYGEVSIGLCVYVCAAGYFGEHPQQRIYRRDRVVLAHSAARPGVAARQAAMAMSVPERLVAPVDPRFPTSSNEAAQHSRRSPVSQTGDRDDH